MGRLLQGAQIKCSKVFIDDCVIFEICLMASKSARMRGSAHLKAVSKILVSKFLFQNCCSRNSCFKISVSKFLFQNSCSKNSVSKFLFQSFLFQTARKPQRPQAGSPIRPNILSPFAGHGFSHLVPSIVEAMPCLLLFCTFKTCRLQETLHFALCG